MRSFVPETHGVEFGSRGKSGPKFDVFLRLKFWGPLNFCGASVNRHPFRPTLQVRLRSMAGLSRMLTK